jgi:hypothetical protein
MRLLQILELAQLLSTIIQLVFFKRVLRRVHLAERLCQAHGFQEALGNPKLL